MSKICKGIGKAKDFQGCGIEHKMRRFGICPSCLYEWATTTENGRIWHKSQFLPKVKKNVERTKKEKVVVLRESLKTISQHKNDLQKQINAIVRLIDKGHPCIATGATKGKRNSGHYISIGSNETLRFHLENIWIQSEHSNMWKSGDTLRYQEGIIKLYGSDYLEYLNSLKSIPPIKLTIEEIKEKTAICRVIVKRLKDQDATYSLQERVALRKILNQEIGIY